MLTNQGARPSGGNGREGGCTGHQYLEISASDISRGPTCGSSFCLLSLGATTGGGCDPTFPCAAVNP